MYILIIWTHYEPETERKGLILLNIALNNIKDRPYPVQYTDKTSSWEKLVICSSKDSEQAKQILIYIEICSEEIQYLVDKQI